MENEQKLVDALCKVTFDPGSFENMDEEFRDHIHVTGIALEKDGMLLQHASERLKADKASVLKAVRSNGNALLFANKSLKSDPDMAWQIALNLPAGLDYVDENIIRQVLPVAVKVKNKLDENLEHYKNLDNSLRNNIAICYFILCRNGLTLKWIPEQLKYDHDLLLAAVRNNGLALQFVPELLKTEHEIFSAAMLNNQDALRFAPLALQQNKDKDRSSLYTFYMTELIQRNPFLYSIIRTADQELEEVTLAALRENGKLLEYAPCQFKSDFDMVLTAVTNSGEALQFASSDLRNDKKLVLAAVTHNGDALKFASEELKDDKEVVIAAVSSSYDALQFASLRLKRDKNVVLEAVDANCGTAFLYMDKELLEDKVFISEAVAKSSTLMAVLPDQYKYNEYLAHFCFSINPDVYAYLSFDLRSKIGWACEALTNSPTTFTFEYIPEHIREAVLKITGIESLEN